MLYCEFTMYMYTVVAVPREDSMRLARLCDCCPVGALQLVYLKLLSKRHVHVRSVCIYM